MFTGIITHTGKLEKKERQEFTFSAPLGFVRKLKEGDSVSVNGCCLTVTNIASNTFSVDIMPETQKRTMLGYLTIGDLVNFELPATPSSFLSGHFMQGHIDGTGVIKKIQQEGNSKILTIILPEDLNRYFVEKGSVAVNGISLTVITVDRSLFTVGIIPYTWKNTMIHKIKTGDLVNIEVDILAKYVEKIIKK